MGAVAARHLHRLDEHVVEGLAGARVPLDEPAERREGGVREGRRGGGEEGGGRGVCAAPDTAAPGVDGAPPF